MMASEEPDAGNINTPVPANPVMNVGYSTPSFSITSVLIPVEE
jgi:hypothetical protein